MVTKDFKAGDVLRVPFPYTDRSTRQRRPALVVSKGGLGHGGALLWVMMITSADHRGWPEDVQISDPADVTGLPIPSIVRPAKIATIEVSEADRIGRVSARTLDVVGAVLMRSIGA